MALTKVTGKGLETLSDGVTITTADNTTQLTLKSTDADSSTGPVLDLVRDSASPADGDAIGKITYIADNDAGEATTYSSAFTTLRDASDGAEDGQVINYVMTNGSLVDHLRMGRGSAGGQSEVVVNEGSADIDFRVEGNGDANAFFVQGSDDFIGIGTGTPKKKIHILDTTSDGIMIFDRNDSSQDHQICFAHNYQSGGQTGGNYFGIGVDDSENDFIIAFDANAQASLAADKILSLTHDGNLAVDGTSSTGGADYAEFFEWSDGNSGDEDRRGYSVVLDGNKIRKSTSDDNSTSIIGVVSAKPAYIGDSAWKDWQGKYEKDDYGNYVMENDERKLSSDFDENQVYVPRKDRKEWDEVGMVGKLRMRKGQTTGDRWIKLRDISSDVEEWLVR